MSYKIRASSLDGYQHFVTEMGGDALMLLNEAGITPQDLTNPDSLIPVDRYRLLLGRTAEVLRCEHFGLLLSQQRRVSHLPLAYSLLINLSANLREFIERSIEYAEVYAQGASWTLNVHEGLAVLRRTNDVRYYAQSPQVVQLAVAGYWQRLGWVSNQQWHPSRVYFGFDQPKDTVPYRRFFSSPVVFGADFSGITFKATDLDIPFTRRDEALYGNLETYVRHTHSLSDTGLVESVRRLIEQNLESGAQGIESVARHLPYDRRTLQRKLRTMGTTYQQLLDEVRFAKAAHQLANSRISLTRLAEKLCYRALSSFSRGFKKHYGVSPKAWRQKSERLP